jgi:hypothetical protein
VPDTIATQVLIEKVQQGDQQALDVLCNRYVMRVLAAVRIRLAWIPIRAIHPKGPRSCGAVPSASRPTIPGISG